MDKYNKNLFISASCALFTLFLSSNHLAAKSNGYGAKHMNQINETSVKSMEEALQGALDTNPEVLFQKAEREATRHKITQAKGNFLPSVTLRSGAGREYVRQRFQASTGTATGLSSLSNGVNNQARYDPSVRLTQRIFDGTESSKGIEKAKNEFEQSTKNVSEAQTLIAFAVFDAYISVRRFERLYRLAQENIRVHQSILSKMRKLVSAGSASSGDEQSVKSRLFDAKAALGDIEGDLLSAYANFKEIVGAEAKNLKKPSLTEVHVPKTLQDAIAKATLQNKSVLVAKATEAVSKSEFDQTIAPFMPSLDLEFEARKSFNVAGKTGNETNVTGQLVGTFNIFNGGKDIGRRREFRARLASAKFQIQREMRRAEKETRVSYAEMISARKQSVELRNAVSSKQKVRDGYMKQFEGGTRSFVDILDASHEYFLAKGSLITADATGDLAISRLYAAMGILLDLHGTVAVKSDMKSLGYDDHAYKNTMVRGKTVKADIKNVSDTKTSNVESADLNSKDMAFQNKINNIHGSQLSAQPNKTIQTAQANTTSTSPKTARGEQVFVY